jgi:hypothetical protein
LFSCIMSFKPCFVVWDEESKLSDLSCLAMLSPVKWYKFSPWFNVASWVIYVRKISSIKWMFLLVELLCSEIGGILKKTQRFYFLVSNDKDITFTKSHSLCKSNIRMSLLNVNHLKSLAVCKFPTYIYFVN